MDCQALEWWEKWEAHLYKSRCVCFFSWYFLIFSCLVASCHHQIMHHSCVKVHVFDAACQLRACAGLSSFSLDRRISWASPQSQASIVCAKFKDRGAGNAWQSHTADGVCGEHIFKSILTQAESLWVWNRKIANGKYICPCFIEVYKSGVYGLYYGRI